MSATLRVERLFGGIIDKRRDWEVLLDGNQVGAVGYAQTVDVAIAPGSHTLRVGLGNHSSHEKSFEVADGAVATFRCRAQLLWPLMIAATFKNDLWITLKEHS
jgi:hypothetical protein